MSSGEAELELLTGDEFPAHEFKGSDAVLDVLDADGRALAHPLIQLRWEDWGALAFQADAQGRLELMIEDDLAGHPFTVHVRTQPAGTDLLAEPFDVSSSELPGSRIRIRRR